MLPTGVERVVVVGLGKVTGLAVVDALLDASAQVRLTDSQIEGNVERAIELRARGVLTELGPPPIGWLDWAQLIVPSPGVPPNNPLLAGAKAAGVPVFSEVELGFRVGRGPIAAITGTNGKTTATLLLSEVILASGRACIAAGNIGLPLIKAERDEPAGTLFICEVSSFQLHYIDSFRARVAVILNVADDHYDWHEDHADYLSSKARITANQTTDDLLIVRMDDEGLSKIAPSSKARIGVLGLAAPEIIRAQCLETLGREPDCMAALVDGALSFRSTNGEAFEMGLSDIRLVGTHNIENVQAVTLAAIALGAKPDDVLKVVRAFEGLPHRMSLVAEVEGVRYIDDSKATNPHATLRALDGLDRVILIAGGRAKGLDLSVLRPEIGRIRSFVAMGEAATEVVAVFEGVNGEVATDVEEAVSMASKMAKPGDTVLLSPACSSWDQYASYSERGDRFAAAVRAL